MGASLRGRGVLVTRPADQAAGLAALVEGSGGRPVLFPAIEIRDLEDDSAARALAARLAEFDLAVFVSPTAVERAFRFIRAWPAGVRAATVGRASRKLLEQRGVRDAIAPPSGADSEALLALPELAAVAGRRVVIFRGEGGRTLLGESLAARGARVEYADCYRRVAPPADPAPLLAEWAAGRIHAVTATSSEGISNLFAMLAGQGAAYLRAAPWFVPHPRIAERARHLGAREVLVAGPGDAQIVARLVAYFDA